MIKKERNGSGLSAGGNTSSHAGVVAFLYLPDDGPGTGGYLTHFDEAGRDTGVLFAVSAVTPKTDPAKLAKTTINYAKRWEQFRGLKDWRLQWSVLTLITIMIYLWLW